MTKADHEAAVNSLMNTMKDNGFDNLQDYSAWDESMCFEAYKEYKPISGFCDGCEGLPIPACVKEYGPKLACYSDRPQIATDVIYRIARKGADAKKSFVAAGNKIVLVCPEGHGFYRDPALQKELPFDIEWKVFR